MHTWFHVQHNQKKSWTVSTPQFCFAGTLNTVKFIIFDNRAVLHLMSKCLAWVACLWSKMAMFNWWRACDLNFVMISSLASKRQDFKLWDLQFHYIKQMKNGHPNFKALPFWIQWWYYNQTWITSTSCHKNKILKSWWEWQPLPSSFPPSETWVCYFINRPPGTNILTVSVSLLSVFLFEWPLTKLSKKMELTDSFETNDRWLLLWKMSQMFEVLEW